ncbi:MAG: response regulator transcription factor [Bryobacterales bacterium]|nr:response regulator transcription factor [Bryobacterales bacterium]MBV9396657.1 response regulator transcription factor [Bryobacterales bacterium]
MDREVMTTLIVDDEPIARSVLREELEYLAGVRVIGEAENGKEALDKIEKLRPDLVLLDLQMPVMGGFEVVHKLGGQYLPVVVIVTAFDEYAIEAFEAGAIDYLLKPVSQARLKKAIERARKLRSKPLEKANAVAAISSVAVQPNFAAGRKIIGRSGSDYVLLDLDEILCFQAEGELVWIVTSKQRLLASQTLRLIEERLQNQPFQRVHRNAIVNVNHIRKMSAMSSNRWMLTLSNSLQIVVSKRQAHNIRKILNW